MLLPTHPHPPLQTTFRVGLALLTGVERELLTADFEQVRPLNGCCGRQWSTMAPGQLPACVVAEGQLTAPAGPCVPVSNLTRCAITIVVHDSVRVALQILGVLNAKWFPAFSRSPVELLKTALSFSVSSRLAKYEGGV